MIRLSYKLETMPTTTYRTCSYCWKEVDEEELDHHRSICESEEIECGNACGVKIPRCMHKQHVEYSCKKRMVNCDDCSTVTLFNEMQDHKQTCSAEIVECSLMCGFRGERVILSKHITENCPRLLVTCTYCSQSIRKSEMNDHVGECKEAMCICDRCGKRVKKEYMNVHMKEYCIKRVKQCVFCDISIDADALVEHYEMCEKLLVQCYEKCGSKIERRELNDHLQICPKRLVMCEFCPFKVEYEFLGYHHSECSKFPIPCREDCGMIIPRELLQQHLDKECEKFYAPCAFKKMHCTYEGFPADRLKHVEESANHHMELMKDMIQENEKKTRDDVMEVQENFSQHTQILNKHVETLEDKIKNEADRLKHVEESVSHRMELMKDMIQENKNMTRDDVKEVQLQFIKELRHLQENFNQHMQVTNNRVEKLEDNIKKEPNKEETQGAGSIKSEEGNNHVVHIDPFYLKLLVFLSLMCVFQTDLVTRVFCFLLLCWYISKFFQ